MNDKKLQEQTQLMLLKLTVANANRIAMQHDNFLLVECKGYLGKPFGKKNKYWIVFDTKKQDVLMSFLSGRDAKINFVARCSAKSKVYRR